ADHRLCDAIAVGGVAPREAPLDAGMAVIRLAVLVRHHPHDALALHLGAERAADAAVGAGGDHAPLRLTELGQRLFHERRGRAGLHTGPARYALGSEESLVLSGCHA